MRRISTLLSIFVILTNISFAQTTLWTLIGTNNNQAKGYGSNIGRSVSTIGGAAVISNGYGGAGHQTFSPYEFDFITATNWYDGFELVKGWKITVNTLHFNTITISYVQGSEYQPDIKIGPKNFKLQYSIDDVNYTDVAGSTADLGYENWNSAFHATNIPLPADCANKGAVYFRWIMRDDAGTGNHMLNNAGESWLANIEVKGTAFEQVAPTKIFLSKTVISTFSPINAPIDIISCDDPNPGDALTYTLPVGGAADNALFSIAGNELRNSVTLTERDYNIRINVNDGTANYAQNFTIKAVDFPVISCDNGIDYITNVTFNTINNTTAKDGTGYGNYKLISTTVNRLGNYTLSVKNFMSDPTYPQYIKAWIDWNNNGSFDDAGEEYTVNSNITADNTTSTKSITIPGDAYPGSIRMRVVIRAANSAGSPTPPINSGNNGYGEAEDYSLNITGPSVTFADGSSFPQPVYVGGNTDQVIGRFKLTGSIAGISLTGASLKLNGTRTGLSNLKLWSSADDAFGGDIQLGSTVAADPGDGNTVTFNSFSNPVTTSGVYYFLTGDVASYGRSGTVQGVIVQNSSLSVYYGIISGTITNAVLSNGTSELPVELTSFTASTVSKGIELKWETATEQNNYGFEVERSSVTGQQSLVNSEDTNWEKIGFVHGAGNSNSPKEYSFIDSSLIQGTMQYRLKQIDLDGNYKFYSQLAEVSLSPTDVKEKQLPTEFGLSQNYPNPFNPSTVISYQLPVSDNVTLKIYDILGNEVSTLVNETKSPGYYSVTFSAANLSTGVYIYRITAGSFTSTKKLMLMK